MSKNRAAVFVGPTISRADASGILNAVYLPPASQGDIYRLRSFRPLAIGVIDGYFEGQPAVWHKELLWAISEGIPVFGASSMGALRAIELSGFGMIGIGRIFQDFANGVLEDDDEVTIVHGSVESGYRAASDAMVNIRYTLQAAAASGVIGVSLQEELCKIAKDMFYAERAFTSLIDKARSVGLSKLQLDNLAEWLPGNYVNQKKEDAVEMLIAMRNHLMGQTASSAPNFVLEPTLLWNELTRSAGVFAPTVTDGQHSAVTVTVDDILTEVRLLDRQYDRVASDAWLRYLLIQSDFRRALPSPPEVAATVDSFRKQMHLEDAQAYEEWLTANDLDIDSLKSMLLDDAFVATRYSELKRHIPARMLEELKLRGEYTNYRTRAALKQRVAELLGGDASFSIDLEAREKELLAWHFGRLGRPIPEDLSAYIRRLDFRDKGNFLHSIAQERTFLEAFESPE